MTTCPLCGAVYPANETLLDRFHRCLVLEYEQPHAYGAVHHLLVLCYAVQHRGYSTEGWLPGGVSCSRILSSED